MVAIARALSLFILGYMISYWGGNELASRARLNFLKDVGAPASPHMSAGDLISQQLVQLLHFFRADACLLVLPLPAEGACRVYRADHSREGVAVSQTNGMEAVQPLLALQPGAQVSFDAKQNVSQLRWSRARAADGTLQSDLAAVANLLETSSFASVPFAPKEEMHGRLYVLSSSHAFTLAETEFLAQAATQMAAAANNVMLTHELATGAARQERSKISRDIHDTTVQSYIGLKLGLEALYREVEKDGMIALRIKELLDMATFTVDDLRSYVKWLSDRESPIDAQLLSKIDEQCRRYKMFHGIQVEVRADHSLTVDSSAGVEAYQVVCEALSNIVRHTSAKRAFVELRCNGNMLAIEVGNASPVGQQTAPFIPRSISERAMSLGGKVQVRLNNEGHDIVSVTIPLGSQRSLAGQPA